MLNLILFGPPGSGKGTQAKKLTERYKIIHISTGDLFRYELGNSTELGELARSYMSKGELVPDEVTIQMLKRKMQMHEDAKGFIFDGFPRTIEQAAALDKLLSESNQKIDALIALEVSDEEIIKRILLRGETSGREDDNDVNIIKNRIGVYESTTAPVYSYYQQYGKSAKIDGLGSIEEIFQRLANHIDGILDRQPVD